MKRSKEEYILLTLCAAGIVGVTPFALLRMIKGQLLLAAIDSAVVLGIIFIGLQVWRTRKVRVAGILLTFFYMCGTVAAIYVSGSTLIYWAFPATTATYFLVKPREAAFISAAAIMVLLPVLLANLATIELASTLMALLLNNIFSFIFARNMQLHHDKLALQATRDSLTGAGNRRLFDERIRESVAFKGRNKTPSSLLILDIDHFKQVNDQYGHIKGDEVLINLVELLRGRLRQEDNLYRLGGEEFAIVTNQADLGMAVVLAEELRELVEKSDLLPSSRITISLGVAECGEADNDKTWFEKADTALYQAKNKGRNQTCIAA